MRRGWFVIAVGFAAQSPGVALAGMPSPLPFSPERVLRLNESAAVRFQAISFFVLAFLFSAKTIQLLWNYFRRDFPALPRLSFGRALAGVFLWGLLFVIVLTMISGARELMTPGAWEKRGATYRLPDQPTNAAECDPETVRRQQLEKLRTALWRFAATHAGHFPIEAEKTVIAAELWEVPESGGMRFFYVPDLKAGHLPEILVYEPELVSGQRLVLKTTGDIMVVPSIEIPKKATKADRSGSP